MADPKWFIRPALTGFAVVAQFGIAAWTFTHVGDPKFAEAVTVFALTMPLTTQMVTWWFKARDEEKATPPSSR